MRLSSIFSASIAKVRGKRVSDCPDCDRLQADIEALDRECDRLNADKERLMDERDQLLGDIEHLRETPYLRRVK